MSKRKVYYKAITRYSRDSAMIRDWVWKRNYPVDKWVKGIRNSKLMIFATIHEAQYFLQMNSHLIVVRCNAKGVVKKIYSNNYSRKGSIYGTDSTFRRFWSKIFTNKKKVGDWDKGGISKFPQGTLFADEVMCLE